MLISSMVALRVTTTMGKCKLRLIAALNVEGETRAASHVWRGVAVRAPEPLLKLHTLLLYLCRAPVLFQPHHDRHPPSPVQSTPARQPVLRKHVVLDEQLVSD